MALDSAAIKRAIIDEAGKNSGIREKIQNNAPQISEGERIEIGNELERMTRTKGWAYVEAYIINHLNPAVTLFMKEDVDKGEARGMMKVIQYVAAMIKHRDELIAKDNAEEK
jgi:hypothetical protein